MRYVWKLKKSKKIDTLLEQRVKFTQGVWCGTFHLSRMICDTFHDRVDEWWWSIERAPSRNTTQLPQLWPITNTCATEWSPPSTTTKNWSETRWKLSSHSMIRDNSGWKRTPSNHASLTPTIYRPFTFLQPCSSYNSLRSCIIFQQPNYSNCILSKVIVCAFNWNRLYFTDWSSCRNV